ncbi:Rho guanine nucleotide exchange factor [Marasmius sp. AFHP31]|nr:Rho guanine nucleotide exchange factor [Marasmius sp. AFHP31]
MMLRLSRHSGLYPKCLTTKNVKRLSRFPVRDGGYGAVYKGSIGEQIVCLKLPKIFEDTEDPEVDKLLKAYMQEAIVWRQLEHPNLLPFIGVYYLDEAPNQLCLISPWMDRGDLTRYLKSAQNQNADIDRLLLANDVAAGLLYLHSKNIVHGDLKGPNVLINADERALIGDFGLSRVVETHTPGLFNSTTRAKGTIRWLSPELLKSDPPCQTSERSDIYAYAGVCYEIFTGKQPFFKLHDVAIYDAVVNRGERPHRPEEAGELSDPMWEIMMSCWQHDQRLRPSVDDVFARVGQLQDPKTGFAARLRSALDSSSSSHAQIWLDVEYPPVDTAVLDRLLSERKSTPSIHGPDNREIRLDVIMRNDTANSGEVPRVLQEKGAVHTRIYDVQHREERTEVSWARGDGAQRYLDILYALLDNARIPSQSHSTILELICNLSKSSGLRPKGLTTPNITRSSECPVAGGSFTEVWKGAYRGDIVCVKGCRVLKNSDVQKLVKVYVQETIIWSRLRHPNLLPFVEIYYLTEVSYMSTSSPWMQRGNLEQFLNFTPKEHVDHLALAFDVASGLAFLHHTNIVHGDLKGVNILITPDLRACIGSFGSALTALDSYDDDDSLNDCLPSSMRWMAPELLNTELPVSTTQSDMFAYGCVCYEIFTGRIPFYDLSDTSALYALVFRRQHPSRPADLNPDDPIWEFITSFWNHDPSLRPTAADALDHIQRLAIWSERGEIQATLDWKIRRKDVKHPPLDLELLY